MSDYPAPPAPPTSTPPRDNPPGNPPGPASPPVSADTTGIAHPETTMEPPDVAQPNADMIAIAGGAEEPGETL